MSDHNPKDVPYALGAVKDNPDPRDFPAARLIAAVELPPSISYYRDMERYVARDQGDIGSCVAHASCMVAQYTEDRDRKGRQRYNFSPRWVYEKGRLPGGGMYIRDGAKIIANDGVPREHLYPYNGMVGDFDPIVINAAGSTYRRAARNAPYYKVGLYARLFGIEDMRRALVATGPFVFGVMWQYDWYRPTERDEFGWEVLGPQSGRDVGGHAITVVGYDHPRRRMLFRNSWGTGWGTGGYAWITYEAIEEHHLDSWAMMNEQRVANKGLLKELRQQIA